MWHRRRRYADLEVCGTLVFGRIPLFLSGDSVAGLEPWKYVCTWRAVFFADRPAGTVKKVPAACPQDTGRGGDHHAGRVGGRSDCKSRLRHLGLPRPSRKLYGAYLPDLLSAVDPGQSGGHRSLRPVDGAVVSQVPGRLTQ